MPYKKLQLLAGKEITVTKNEKTLKIEIPGITYAVYKVK
jgi:hypothetical protein